MNNSQHVGIEESDRHIYHVLEGPGDDADYEDLDAELEKEDQTQGPGKNLYYILEEPTLEMEGSEGTTADNDTI